MERTIERRKNHIEPTPADAARMKYLALRSREQAIQDQIKEGKPVVEGKIDFSRYDALMAELREVRAGMASLVFRGAR